eukprot:scaffold64632_cov31-Tisochrysis_lutea.AAC.3
MGGDKLAHGIGQAAHRIGELRPRDFEGLEVVHRRISVREELVLHDRVSARRGCHVGRDDDASLTR